MGVQSAESLVTCSILRTYDKWEKEFHYHDSTNYMKIPINGRIESEFRKIVTHIDYKNYQKYHKEKVEMHIK